MINYAYSQDPTHNAFNEFLRDYGIYLAIGVAFFVLIIICVLLFVHFKANEKAELVVESPKLEGSIYDYLGGKENVIEHSRNGSRIFLTLKDDSKLNKEKIKGIGVDSIIKMSNKTILVVKSKPEEFYRLFS